MSAEIITIIASAATVVGVLATFMFWLFSKLDQDIRGQQTRIDQLYQMFVDLVKEGKK